MLSRNLYTPVEKLNPVDGRTAAAEKAERITGEPALGGKGLAARSYDKDFWAAAGAGILFVAALTVWIVLNAVN